jgi:hypothetical protein
MVVARPEPVIAGSMQTFGTYATEAEAIAAYDIGAILIQGTDARLNHSLTEYMAGGCFHEDLQIPEKVIHCIQAFLDAIHDPAADPKATRLDENLSRIRKYFRVESDCPFKDRRQKPACKSRSRRGTRQLPTRQAEQGPSSHQRSTRLSTRRQSR